MDVDCMVCRKHQGNERLLGGVIFENDVIFVSHAQLWGDETDHYLGHIFIEPKRHAPGLGDMTRVEAEMIGAYTSMVAKALVEMEGVEHVYSFVLGHHVPHLHVHVIGRYPGAPQEYWGTRVDDWPEAPRGGEAEISLVAERIREFLKNQAEVK